MNPPRKTPPTRAPHTEREDAAREDDARGPTTVTADDDARVDRVQQQRAARDRQDRALIRKIRRGDEQAFRALVLVYRDRIYALCFRILGERHEAEEVAQEVFLTVHRAVAGWRGESRFYTWLYRVATNHCNNRIKYLKARNFHRAEPLESAAYAQQVADGVPDAHALQRASPRPDQQVEAKRLESIIQRELGKLDPEHRTLIILRDVEGLSYQDIVEITQLAEGTVKSRLHRARLALQRRIAPHLR